MATRSFDYDAIWLKAITFINRALDDTDDFEERAFWAACSLELLGKAALTKVNPALIADITAMCQCPALATLTRLRNHQHDLFVRSANGGIRYRFGVAAAQPLSAKWY
jgi:hypothetical protein